MIEAEQIFDDMLKRGNNHDSAGYDILIRGYLILKGG